MQKYLNYVEPRSKIIKGVYLRKDTRDIMIRLRKSSMWKDTIIKHKVMYKKKVSKQDDKT